MDDDNVVPITDKMNDLYADPEAERAQAMAASGQVLVCPKCQKFKVPVPLDHVGDALLRQHVSECFDMNDIPIVWRQAGDAFVDDLVQIGCNEAQIAALSSGAGAFGAYLQMNGWTLLPPPSN